MSDATHARARPSGVLASAAAATVLWLAYAATAGDPLLGQPPVRPALEGAAIAATTLLFIAGGGVLIIALLPGGSRATELQRTLVHGLLALIAAYIVLSHYGRDLRAVLATSAIVTAAIGLAMQPTLGSIISGVVLNVDYKLRAGDWIIRGGEAMEVESLGWRNVVARAEDGRLIVFPNAKLADAELEFVPANAAVRVEACVTAPTGIPPDQVKASVASLLEDMPALDPSRPIGVSLREFDPGAASTRYSVRCWVGSHHDVGAVQSAIQGRLWYRLRRAGLYGPPASGPDAQAPSPPAQGPRLAELLQACRPELDNDVRSKLIEQAEVVLYAAGESIVLPRRFWGQAFLLLRGKLVDAAAEARAASEDGGRPRLFTETGIHAERYLARMLSRHIGPYADYAVRWAARETRSFDTLCLKVAEEIADTVARAQFLDDVRPTQLASLNPGVVFKPADTAYGGLDPGRILRAGEEVTLLAVPADMIEMLGGNGVSD